MTISEFLPESKWGDTFDQIRRAIYDTPIEELFYKKSFKVPPELEFYSIAVESLDGGVNINNSYILG